MKLDVIVALIVAVGVALFLTIVQPMRRAGAARSHLETILKAKQPIPDEAPIILPTVGAYTMTQEILSAAPVAIDIKDKMAAYSGPGGGVKFYYAKTTDWGREPIDYAGVMQSTSRAMAKNAQTKLLRLDVADHPLVRGKLPDGDCVVCWMNRDNLFCISGSDEATTAFLTAYPY